MRTLRPALLALTALAALGVTSSVLARAGAPPLEAVRAAAVDLAPPGARLHLLEGGYSQRLLVGWQAQGTFLLRGGSREERATVRLERLTPLAGWRLVEWRRAPADE